MNNANRVDTVEECRAETGTGKSEMMQTKTRGRSLNWERWGKRNGLLMEIRLRERSLECMGKMGRERGDPN